MMNSKKKFPASGTGYVSKPRLTSKVRKVWDMRIGRCVSAVRTEEVPVFVCLCGSCNYEAGVPEP
jgi:hypothetical protein